jgi:GNAT superfamily N-acetyltransferase
MTIIEINTTNISYLNTFLCNDLSPSFRYFNNKAAEQIIENHYKTLLFIENDIPKGYAHIDYDIINDKYWFGICVAPSYYRQGIGQKLIDKTLEYFKESIIDLLNLTVDKSNTIAYNLYIKNGFVVQRETPSLYIMSLTKSNILYLPVSYGEAIDKLTILDIKLNKITDTRRHDIEKEFNVLYNQLKNIIKSIQFYYEALKQINLQIWEDQDRFRYSTDELEKNTLCKKIIEDNDARFRIKNKINNMLSSFLKEQKGYKFKISVIPYSSNTAHHKFLNNLIKYQLFFNDKVIIKCNKSIISHVTDLFNNDKSIEIDQSLDESPTNDDIMALNQMINNKSFFKFIEISDVKPKLFIITHNELGDIINHCGMFRYFSTIYDEVMFACRRDYLKQIQYMFEDNKKITFYPVDRYRYDGSELIPSSELDIIKINYDVLKICYHTPLRKNYDFSIIPFTFYQMANVPSNIFWDYYSFRETDEAIRLYMILTENNIQRYVFCHCSISNRLILNPEDIKYKLNVDYNDTLFICTDYNIYNKDHKFYNIANEFVMKHVLDYTKIIENASYVVLTDSCIFCLSLHIPIKTKECYYVNCRINSSYSYIFDEKYGFNDQRALPIFRKL